MSQLPNLSDGLFSAIRQVDELDESDRSERLPNLHVNVTRHKYDEMKYPRRPRGADSAGGRWRCYDQTRGRNKRPDQNTNRFNTNQSHRLEAIRKDVRVSHPNYMSKRDGNQENDFENNVASIPNDFRKNSVPFGRDSNSDLAYQNDKKVKKDDFGSQNRLFKNNFGSDDSDNGSVASGFSSVSSRSYPRNFSRDTNTKRYPRNQNHRFRGDGDDDSDRNSVVSSSGVFSRPYSRNDAGRNVRNEKYNSRYDNVKKNNYQNASEFNRKGEFGVNSNENDHENGRSSQQQKKRFFGYRYLEELSKKEPHQIIPEIIKPNSPFDTYLDKDELNADWLFLILNIIKTVCLSEFQGNKNEMLDKLCKSRLLHLISYYLGEAFMEKNKKTVENLGLFVRDLAEFFAAVIAILPSVAKEKELKRHIMKTKVAIDQMNHHLKTNIEEEVIKKFDVLMAKMEDYEKVLEKTVPSKPERSFFDKLADMTPPENFRELSLYPTYSDLMNDRLGFVRPNKISGAYDDVEHYLDVQFRLLREDFIDPLRRGIRKFVESRSERETKKKLKYESVRFYLRTQFLHIENSKTNDVGFVVDFDLNKKMRNIKWQTSKRFMFGSLLLFTNDNFASFFYGTVLERDIEKLKDGKVLVKLADDEHPDKDFFTSNFLMAESEVYFEPYYLVMKLLKTLNEDNFPMRKYIIEGRAEREYPLYLYSFNTWDILGTQIPPLETASWPSAAALGLDQFQHRAFRSALTNDFCVIQGPPGTGKTFIGLKIVQVLLRNAALNPQAIKLPILVVCFTNHALDQFLEGILEHTQDIIRIGGQSRSETLKPFNLRGRSNLAHLRKNAGYLLPTMTMTRREIKQFREKIDQINKQKEAVERPAGIIKYSLLSSGMLPNQRKIIKTEEALIEWLLVKEDEYMDCDDEDEMNVLPKPSRNNESDEVREEEEFEMDDEDENEIVDEDDIFEISENRDVTANSFYCATVDHLAEIHLQQYALYKDACQRLEDNFEQVYNLKHELHKSMLDSYRKYDILKSHLEEPKFDARAIKFLLKQDLRAISFESRWLIYWSWISSLKRRIIQELQEIETKYRNKMTQYEEYKQMEDLCIVKNARVVGMTTTGAARLQILLKELKPAIVVVEEAAEVLEAHIVSSLNSKCQHVILIGDHKQLKPSVAVYELSKHYNVDISLFERVINNKMDCPILNIQHRMRPEISKLITPLIYPDLLNDESVLRYENVRGVEKNLFFLEHDELEQVEEDTASKKNRFEAEFMLELARYLILNGHGADKITILTTYTGQMFLLRELKRNKYSLLRDVRCIVVDKYQGEENDIVLLSLVRNNEEGKIGFLNIENRVCVALSRAKKGLYICGNMDILTKKSQLWTQIKKTLEDQNAIGRQLRLYCETHDKITAVSKAEDFDQVREGGCNQFCGELMECGHNCASLCHIIDKEHQEIKCREPCQRLCPRMHPCKLFCFQTCRNCTVPVRRNLPCGHQVDLPCYVDAEDYLCLVEVEDVSPLCNHQVQRKCHQKAEDVDCQHDCEDRLECGHACPQLCHKKKDPDHLEFKCKKPCEKLNKDCSKAHKCKKLCFEKCGNCSVLEEFQLICGHIMKAPCSSDLSKLNCYKKCTKTCPNCKLKCKKQCYENCNPCTNMVVKTIPECNHQIKIKCSENATREKCQSRCDSIAPCGHKCKAACRKPCGSEKCFELVKSRFVKPLCGHEYVNLLCYRLEEIHKMDAKEFLPYCSEPCNTILQCGDVCGGSCGKCWQGRLHWDCQEKCGSVLICGHSCKFPCRQICPPCNEPCGYRCMHSKCPKTCGAPCVPCQEQCEWKCKHQKCNRKCGAFCNRKPCMEPCDKVLEKCGHPCIGFCGEPCPPLCRECNPEVTEIMFGYEDEPDARFVLLEDCNHVIESQALDQHLSIAPEGGEIVMKVCPLCKTSITKTLRYMNIVKRTYQDIQKVKQKIFGNEKPMFEIRTNLSGKLLDLLSQCRKSTLHHAGVKTCTQILQNYLNIVKIRKQRHTVNNQELKAIQYYCDVFDNIISRFGELKETSEATKNTLETINLVINRIDKISLKINEQLMKDINDELKRYHRLVDFCSALCNPMYAPSKTYESVHRIKRSIENVLFGFRRFTVEDDNRVMELFKDFQREIKSNKPLTKEEKRMVHLAMSSSFHGGTQSSGHWFTCTNGHYYCITECGGAMQTSRCPECKETIGGTNHRYVPTARVASDMDGATRPAWSTGIDVRNYAFF